MGLAAGLEAGAQGGVPAVGCGPGGGVQGGADPCATVGAFGCDGCMEGNVFTTEVDTGKRAQKFLAVGDFVLRKRVP
ncbi:hypothetical protein [Methylobacterium sp. J-077]|uniref:hypothetical protein n=1 Tax=Methylobacterium sp. J-077 TaxID=2836656 RepID=UPI001FB8C13D|nr:hypothetical protein [Methylobacterium sp. J-077]